MSLRLFAALLLAGCPRPVEAPHPDAGPRLPRVAHVVVTTGPFFQRAPRLAATWQRENGWPSQALVLSTGLSPSTSADSLALRGAADADLFKHAGGAALTAGPRDLDLGAEPFKALISATGATLLLSTVRAAGVPSSTLATFTRDGVRLAVIGVSTLSKSDGAFEALPLEGALATTLTAAAQADVVVALVDGCSTPVKRLLEQHRDWRVDLVVATPCDGTPDSRVGATSLLHPGPESYAALRVEVGAVRAVSAQVVTPTSADEEPQLAALRDAWLAKLAAAREAPVATLKAPPDAPASARLVAAALAAVPGANAGLFTSKAVRGAGLPVAVTRGALLDALAPDHVFLVDVPGEVLTKLVSHPDAFLSLPAKVQPEGSYVLAMTREAFERTIGLEAVDANPVDSGLLAPDVVEAFLARAPQPVPLPAPPKRR